jgi:hypothetical protein
MACPYVKSNRFRGAHDTMANVGDTAMSINFTLTQNLHLELGRPHTPMVSHTHGYYNQEAMSGSEGQDIAHVAEILENL